MRKSVLLGVGLLAAATVSGTVAAQTAPVPWLHVRVEEPNKAHKVSVNLPLTVVEAVLKASPDFVEKHGKIHLGRHDGHHHGLRLADLRSVWKELMAVGDAELVTVESEDENVKVQRKGDLVLVHVDHKPQAEKDGKGRKGGEQVRVEVPVSLVDALLSGEGEQANIEAAIVELRKRRGDIVRVQDDESHVRVWIDEQSGQTAGGR